LAGLPTNRKNEECGMLAKRRMFLVDFLSFARLLKLSVPIQRHGRLDLDVYAK
jgi:hypothetical protein